MKKKIINDNTIIKINDMRETYEKLDKLDIFNKDKKTKSVYVVLTMTGTLAARIIRIYTGEPYSHASIAFDEDLGEMYSFARKNLHNPFNAGFVEEHIETGVFGFYKEITTCSIYRLRVTEEQYILIKDEVDKFRRNSNIFSYNFMGILGTIIHRPIEKKNKYICSQFVAYILEKGGIKLFNKNCALVRPFDLRTCSKLHKVYEGKLIEYKEFIKENQLIDTNTKVRA